MVNGLQGDGAIQSYFNDAMNQEVSIQVSGISADTSAGGVRMNMIPRDGGNRVSGDYKVAFRPGDWQSSNLTNRHVERGLSAGNAIDRIFDTTLSLSAARSSPQQGVVLHSPGVTSRSTTSSPTPCRTTAAADSTTSTSRAGSRASPGRSRTTTSCRPTSTRSTSTAATTCRATKTPKTASLQWFSPAYHTAALKYTSTLTNCDAVRGRVLAQPRVLHEQLPGRRGAAALHERLVRRRVTPRE